MDCSTVMSHPEKFFTYSEDVEEQGALGDLKNLTFSLANVECPRLYINNDLKTNPDTRALTNFMKGTTTLGFVFKHGVMIAVDSRASMGCFIASSTCRKVIELNDYLLATIAGGAADCAFWGRHLGRLCRLHELRTKERISTVAASNLLANIFFQYRGYGLSCGMMLAGYNQINKKGELYYVDDSGARVSGQLFSIGSGSTYAYGILDSAYSYELEMDPAVELCKRAIYHATHRDGGSGGVVRVYHVHASGWTKIEEGLDVNELHYKYAEEKGVRPDVM